ncbi:hypothetical protein DJ021_05405 [Phenylobacterium hankyongense]|uniref:HTH LytTR-type domain-containing protein n=1 Tax=Phenylobacterium hankyongense TaxID=1813876 RepID=A0A328B2N8_9CAUL|nr:LytTR family DNA-binding domain-containing protein [Phenylobacterium hankyongense]RAK59278.1 hypothetical protein DJ021_05405 [Phenylobacterium hankyongense]
MTHLLRQAPRSAFHASRAAPITPRVVVRSLAWSGAVGAFLSFVGAFGSQGWPFLPRTLVMVAVGCAGSALGMLTFRLAGRLRFLDRSVWLQALGGALMMILPMSLVIWLVSAVSDGRPMPSSHLPGLMINSGVMCVVMTFLAVALNRNAELRITAREPAPPKFLERLPLKLRGAEVWAVEAEDHYLRLHTSKGQDLILMRLSDAVAELEGIEGAQAHRSWWVARDAIAEARRGDGRATLTLKDGSQVPVSRTYARVLRERGWI